MTADLDYSGMSQFLLAMLLAGLVGLVFIGLIGPALTPRTSPNIDLGHADRKHGQDAQIARDWVQRHGEYCRWECPDGRTRYVCPMKGEYSGHWAIVVMEGVVEITAFLTDSQEYVRRVIEPCHNPWRLSHP